MATLFPDVIISKPQISLVYSREDFADIPLPERVAQYPELLWGQNTGFCLGFMGFCAG
jgi:hypothetical protein